MSEPLIGITGCRLLASSMSSMDDRWAATELDITAADFAKKIAAAGGIPVVLPYEARATVLDRLDAVVITGGQDVHPARWGGDGYVDPSLAPDRGRDSAYDLERDDHELSLVRAAIENRVPLLGVCRGNQVLNVARGGTLVPDLGSPRIEHYSRQSPPYEGAQDHVVEFAPNTLARTLYGPAVQRNSWHHQAVDRPGDGLVVSGRTSDGVVESIELPGLPVLGVQWHPEWQLEQDPVFDWLVSAAQLYSVGTLFA